MCNPAHEHLKQMQKPFLCFVCGHKYKKGKSIGGNTMKQEKKGPVMKFRAGSIEIAGFENEFTTKEGQVIKTVNWQISRGYKDKADEWQNTNSLRKNDLLSASRLLEKAFDWENSLEQ